MLVLARRSFSMMSGHTRQKTRNRRGIRRGGMQVPGNQRSRPDSGRPLGPPFCMGNGLIANEVQDYHTFPICMTPIPAPESARRAQFTVPHGPDWFHCLRSVVPSLVLRHQNSQYSLTRLGDMYVKPKHTKNLKYSDLYYFAFNTLPLFRFLSNRPVGPC